MKKTHLFPIAVLLVIITISLICCKQNNIAPKQSFTFEIPPDYLKEAPEIPDFWVSEYKEVYAFLDKTVKKGKIEIIGTSAGGREIRAVVYGTPRQGKGTTTFSGSLGFGDVAAYRGPDHGKTVYMGMAAVHGGEFEGIVGMVNLISVLETGKDLRGKEWPLINEVASRIDRLVLIPVTNPDGRERIPLRMELYRDTDFTVAEYLNTGGDDKGKITGWPQIKEFIPMDFSKPGFPGGYPNDNGVNFQHDNFLGKKQPETQALFDLTDREKPDLIINLHTGAMCMRMDRPLGEPALHTAFDTLFHYVHSELAIKGLQYTNDPAVEGNAAEQASTGAYNLDGALNWHCGALSVVVESPSHSFSATKETQKKNIEVPDNLLDAQLICHQQAMKFLAETGGRSKWLPGRKR
ncbi:MAG: hypothetical protein IPN68_14220 [Bacteroidetes bacterium]|nr:hypothetical protein [Bacteroidota bacterium]